MGRRSASDWLSVAPCPQPQLPAASLRIHTPMMQLYLRIKQEHPDTHPHGWLNAPGAIGEQSRRKAKGQPS